MINVIDSYRESECESIKHTRTHTHTVGHLSCGGINRISGAKAFFFRSISWRWFLPECFDGNGVLREFGSYGWMDERISQAILRLAKTINKQTPSAFSFHRVCRPTRKMLSNILQSRTVDVSRNGYDKYWLILLASYISDVINIYQ